MVFPERGMLIVILTVSLAAFLQGHVQSSINGASMYPDRFHPRGSNQAGGEPDGDWWLGAMNASPFLFAAVLGCPLALPINDLLGRRGAMAVAALLILVSSLGSAAASEWHTIFGIRVINGVGT